MAGRRDYDDDKEKIRQFLEEFTSPDDGSGRKNFKYYDQMVKLAHRLKATTQIPPRSNMPTISIWFLRFTPLSHNHTPLLSL